MGSDILVGKRNDIIARVLRERSYTYKGLTQELVDHEIIDNIIYGAVKVTDENHTRTEGVVIKIQRESHPLSRGTDNEAWSVKVMFDREGPFMYDCPPRILNLLTPTEHPWAMNWRTKCWDTARRVLENVERLQQLREKTQD